MSTSRYFSAPFVTLLSILLLLKLVLCLYLPLQTSQYETLTSTFFSPATSWTIPNLLFVPLVKIFGLTPIPGLIFELTTWLLTGVLVGLILKSRTVSLIFFLCPLFLWPGNWSEKFYVLLISLVWALLKNRPKLLTGIVLTVCLLFVFTSPSHLSFLRQPYITGIINQLRGEDQKFGLPYLGKILHNKASLALVASNQTLGAFDWSFWFGQGDHNPISDSQWIPPFTLSMIYFLFLSLLKLRQSHILPWTILLLSIMYTSLSHSLIYESYLFLPAFCLVLIIGKSIRFSQRLPQLLILFSLFQLLCSAYFSLNFHPLTLLVDTGYGLDQVIRLSENNPHSRILFSDDLYTHPLAALSFKLRLPLGSSQNAIGNIVSVPPNHPDIAFPTTKRPPSSNVIRLVSHPLPTDFSSNYQAEYTPFVTDYFGNVMIYKLIYVQKI